MYMSKRLLLIFPVCLMFLACNSKENDELRNQNVVLSEENKSLKLQLEELESQNKELSEKLEKQNSSTSEDNNVKTGMYSGEWFTDGMGMNDEEQKFYPSHIIIKENNDNSYEIIGYSGINSFAVSAAISDESIKLHDDFISTNIPGAEDVMNFEKLFLKCLRGASEIQVLRGGEGRYLNINNLEEKISLWFRYGEPGSIIPDVPKL